MARSQDDDPGSDQASALADGHLHELRGQRIGVTASRRGGDLCSALERHGAQVLHAPALSVVPAEHDIPVINATKALLERRPDALLVSTGYGLRRWLETADATGLGGHLREVIAGLEMVVRGSKAAGQVAALDLEPESMTVVTHVDEGVDLIIDGTARRVAVQLSGVHDDAAVQRLFLAGRDVQTLVPYRLQHAGRPAVQSLVQEACARRLNAIVFIAAPAVDSVFAVARHAGLYDELLRAFKDGSVAPAVVGEVCARPLQDAGVEPVMPDRPRMAEIVRLLCERAEDERLHVETRHGHLELRGSRLTVEDDEVWLTPQQVAVMRALATANGAVISRPELIKAVPGLEGAHALEMTVSRLRRKLPAPLVRTVVKRGYGLDITSSHRSRAMDVPNDGGTDAGIGAGKGQVVMEASR